jgi:hypothetical protein
MLRPYTLRHYEILSSLFNLKSGTMGEIGIVTGCNPRCGMLYKLKPFLILYGILVPKKRFTYHDNMEVYYKINHTELFRFLFTETFLTSAYKKFIHPGKAIMLREMKPKEIDYGKA